LRSLVHILYDQRYWRPRRYLRACGFMHEHAREDLHGIGLAPLAGKARLTRAAFVQIGLNVALIERNTGRGTIHDTSYRRAVAFAEGRDAEKMPERVERHRVVPAGMW